MKSNKFINNKINNNIFNKFFFLKEIPKIKKLTIYISNFKNNDKLVLYTLLEELFCIKPKIKTGNFFYDKSGNKIFSDYILLNINNKEIIYNFLLLFFIITKNYKNRKLFFRGITQDKYIGVFSTYDIQTYFYREMFSFIAFNFPFIIFFNNNIKNKANNLIIFHFFKNFGIF